ncbi:MAG: hypothetical protein B6D39_11530 [Anaerolineae bacterium UTCFX2]|jgi:hypothetical protein|nr:MAG: hypothetical protein B6D39_11530 [Anaerolineae bacterium UTCFX2]
MQLNPFDEENPLERSQSPVVYVEENPTWEYKLLTRDLEREPAPTETELDPLGEDGWEMAGLALHQNRLYCYFKRLK